MEQNFVKVGKENLFQELILQLMSSLQLLKTRRLN